MDIVYSKTGWSNIFGPPDKSQVIKKEKAEACHAFSKGGHYYVTVSEGAMPRANIHIRSGRLGRMHAISIIDERCPPLGYSAQITFELASEFTARLMRLVQVVYTSPVTELEGWLVYQRFTQGIKELSGGKLRAASNIIRLRKDTNGGDWERVWTSPLNEDEDVSVDRIEFMPESPFGGAEALLCVNDTPIPLLTNMGWTTSPIIWPSVE